MKFPSTRDANPSLHGQTKAFTLSFHAQGMKLCLRRESWTGTRQMATKEAIKMIRLGKHDTSVEKLIRRILMKMKRLRKN